MARLAFDFSRRVYRLAAEAEGRRAELALDLGNGGSARIADATGTLLSLVSAGPPDVTECVVARGPGSFTGLRVAFSFALGFARAAGAVVRAAPLPEAIALAAARSLPPAAARTLLVALDAMRGEAYVATVRLSNGVPAGPPAPVSILPAAAIPGAAGAADLALVDRAIAHPRDGSWLDAALSPLDLIDAIDALEIAAGAPLPAAPLYVRPSAAREKRGGA